MQKTENQYSFVKRREFKKKRKQESNPRQYQYISQEAKELFLQLILFQSFKIQDAAEQAGIKYSSAKTILFAHRKQFKDQLIRTKIQAGTIQRVCGYKIDNSQPSKVSVITRVGCFSYTQQ